MDHSFDAQDDVIAAVGLDDSTDFSWFELEGGLLEGFLHLSFLEEAKVSSPLAAGALWVLSGNLSEGGGVLFDLFKELFDVVECFFSGSGDWFVAIGVEGSSGFFMFLQDVCAVYWHNLNVLVVWMIW